MRLFFIHVLGVRPECLQNRRRTKATAPREWCTDGVAASSSAPGMLGPVLAFRGEIEAQGRGSLHPHILVWLVCMSSRLLVQLLRQEPGKFKTRLAHWMKACVASMESNCQSSVQALPRQFGDLDNRLTPLPFSKTERVITRFDGGSELEELRAEAARVGELTAAQQEFVDTEDEDLWRRPKFAPRDANGAEIPEQQAIDPPRVSVYGKRLDEFAVSKFPSYRRHSVLRWPCQEDAERFHRSDEHELLDAMSAGVWEKLFAQDVKELAREILVHICGESCYKYSGPKVQQICRHGYYYIVSLADYHRRRRGKPLRNSLFVIRQNKFGMEGRVMLFQEHPFECQSNYLGVAANRCNLDVQDLRRVLSPEYWMEAGEELPHLEARDDWGYMNVYEWDGEGYVPRQAASSSPQSTKQADQCLWQVGKEQIMAEK